MKKLTITLLTAILVFPLFSQVEMGKTKNTIMGKGKLLALETDKMMLDNFTINLICYQYAEDQAGNNAKGTMAQVGVRATLTEIDETLAQEIVNEAYAYFIDQWKNRGVEVFSPSKEEIEATKKYSKAASKGKNANIISGGTWRNADKKTNIIYAWPEGTNIATSGSGPLAANGNFAHVVPDYKGNFFYTSFGSTVNFISFKTAKLGSTASVKTFPRLKAANSMGVQKWQKTKVGGYLGSNEADGIEDFYSERVDEEIDVLSSSMNMWNYVGDKAKYKTGALEMIKKGMDDMFADYDAVVAKENG